ncbi:MAG: hypothetical protein JSW58_16885 [Candidatus Latescibacterota bacterium]|nr:MAG: hypothetical protein JSW58_16885 [Candidatus Latescibacterota bacterium]
MRSLLSVIIAYIGSRLVFGLFEFDYNLLGDPFHIGKLTIDLCVFVVCYLAAY